MLNPTNSPLFPNSFFYHMSNLVWLQKQIHINPIPLDCLGSNLAPLPFSLYLKLSFRHEFVIGLIIHKETIYHHKIFEGTLMQL